MFNRSDELYLNNHCAKIYARCDPPCTEECCHMKTDLEQRITFNPRQCGGQPCIRGLRIRVTDILEMLAQGVDQDEMLADFPDLEAADIKACLHFAARRAAIARLAA